MSELPLGIVFKEYLSGGVTIGERNPEAGAKIGQAMGTVFKLDARITIENLDQFFEIPDFTGRLDGSVDFPMFGRKLPIAKGEFNLQQAVDLPGAKYLTYEFLVNTGGKDYLVVGRKEIHDDPGFDVLEDNSTLFVSIHEGGHRDGRVAGSGILTLSMTNLTRLLASLKATGKGTRVEKARTVSKFGKFFLREMWDSYK
jgi:hypothetical protein